MVDFVVVLIIARKLSARARARGYPRWLAAVGVLGWVTGEATGVFVGARLGLDLAVLITGAAGGLTGVLVASALIDRLPRRPTELRVDELEDAFR